MNALINYIEPCIFRPTVLYYTSLKYISAFGGTNSDFRHFIDICKKAILKHTPAKQSSAKTDTGKFRETILYKKRSQNL